MKLNFSDHLRKLRNDAGLTIAQAAKLVGATYSAYQSWELGMRTPKAPAQANAIERLKTAGK